LCNAPPATKEKKSARKRKLRPSVTKYAAGKRKYCEDRTAIRRTGVQTQPPDSLKRQDNSAPTVDAATSDPNTTINGEFCSSGAALKITDAAA
jgi:hypothetical protein